MADDFFNNGDKAYSENLNDAILVGNSFDWMVSVDLPGDTGGVFPNSSSVVKAKVCDVSAAPNSNLGIGSAISNNSGSEQVYRLTVYPNFNRFGGFTSVSLTADSGVSFYLANKGASSPIVDNLDYSDLGSVPELKVLKEYDLVLTIPSGKSVSGLSFVLQSKSASVSASISQANVAGLSSTLNSLESDLEAQINTKVNVADIVNDLTSTDADKPLSARQGKVLNSQKIEHTTDLGGSASNPIDLNTFWSDGEFYVKSDSITNSPSNLLLSKFVLNNYVRTTCILSVNYPSTEAWCFQTLKGLNNNSKASVWVRQYVSGIGWTDWSEL